MAKKTVSVILDQEDYEKLKFISDAEKRTISSMIRFMLTQKYEALTNQNKLVKEDIRA